MSPDGHIITGSVSMASYEGGRAGARWSAGQEFVLLEGPPLFDGGPVSMMFVDGKAVRDDGQVYGTCVQYGAYGEPLACRFSAPGSVQTFGACDVYGWPHLRGQRNERGRRAGGLSGGATESTVTTDVDRDLALALRALYSAVLALWVGLIIVSARGRSEA